MTSQPRQQIHRNQALAAASRLAHDLDLDDDLEILSDRGNLVVRFGDDPVVGRVACLTAFTRKNPLAWMQREVDVAKALFMIGGPVVPPVAGMPYGPCLINDVPITLWEYNQPREFAIDPSMVAFDYHNLFMKMTELDRLELPWL